MGQQFTPTQTFEADVNGRTNRYIQGQVYTVHDTPQHKDLAKKVQHWASEGRVQILGVTPGASRPATIETGGGS